MTKDDARFPAGWRGFLSKAYDFKAVADYDTGQIVEVSSHEAAEAVEAARQFVAIVRHALHRSPQLHERRRERPDMRTLHSIASAGRYSSTSH